MNPRPDGRPTFEEAQAARRREVAARLREIEAARLVAPDDAPPAPSPRPLRLRLSDEPVDPAPPRKGDAEILRRSAAVRAALTDAEAALLDALQDTLRRRADLRLRPEIGAAPPPLPGTPEERAALREKISRVRPPRATPSPARHRGEKAAEDFEDLGPADVETDLRELI